LIWDEIRNVLGKTEKKLFKVIEELSKLVEEVYEILLAKCFKKEEITRVLYIIIAA